MRSNRHTNRSTRRKLVWARHSLHGATIASGVPVKINLLQQFETAYGANLLGATVTRIRGVVAAGNNISPVATGQLMLGARIGVTTEVSADNNGPDDVPYADWMLWEPFVFQSLPASGQTADSVALSREIDVKSQRKLEELDDELQMWISATGTPFAYSWRLSILLKLA